jgi:hypothetical protein
MVERKRFRHLAAFAAAVVLAVVVLALVDQGALAVVVGLIGIGLIAAAVPVLTIEREEHEGEE